MNGSDMFHHASLADGGMFYHGMSLLHINAAHGLPVLAAAAAALGAGALISRLRARRAHR